MNDPTPKVVYYRKHYLEDVDNEVKVITVNINCSDDDGRELLLLNAISKKPREIYKKKKVLIGTNIFQNSDIICNILSFVPFANRWRFKLLNRAFYNAFNTKYAWSTLDFQFVDIDLFNMRFLDKYQRFFDHTHALSIAVNEKNNIDRMVNTLTNLFKHLKDLRLYYRKRNANVIYEYVHPVVMHFMKNAIRKDIYKKGKKSREEIKRYLDNKFKDEDVILDIEEQIKEKVVEPERKEEANDTTLGDLNETNEENIEFMKNTNVFDSLDNTGTMEEGDFDIDKNSTINSVSSSNETVNNEPMDFITCDFSDLDECEIKTFFLQNAFYKYLENKNENENKTINYALFQKYVNLIETKKLCRTKQISMDSPYASLERLIIDVELKGSDLLYFIGKLNNLKDILISKLIYGNKLNRSQNIIIFTSFIEQVQSNNIRMILLDMYYRYDYKPSDYLEHEKYRDILRKRKEHVFDKNKEEGDELIYILQKSHVNSLNCLWSNDLCISYEMYKQLKKFKNLQVWILPGWRALSLAKQ